MDNSTMYYNISNFSSQDIMKKKISIDNYYSNRRETAKINSPRSLKAIENLGYKPEQLKYSKCEQYSRRIDEQNRLVYRIDGERIIIDSCKGHYED